MSIIRLLPASLLFCLLAGCGDDAPTCETVGFDDADGDGFGDPSSPLTSCDSGSPVDNADDCDDADANSYPGAEERCDDQDNDCDGEVDEDAVDPLTWWPDADGDGFGDSGGTTTVGCHGVAGTSVSQGGDCDDADATVNPAAEPVCGDEVDNNCDGLGDCAGGFSGELWADEASAVLAPATASGEFGAAIFSLGDVTGDGTADVVAGWDGFSTDMGFGLDVFQGPLLADGRGAADSATLSTPKDRASLIRWPEASAGPPTLILGQPGDDGLICAIHESPSDAGAFNYDTCLNGVGGTGAALATLPAFAGTPGFTLAVASPSADDGAGRVTFIGDWNMGEREVNEYPNFLVGDAHSRALGDGAMVAGDLDGDGNTDLLVPGSGYQDGLSMAYKVVYLVSGPVIGATSIADAAASWIVSDGPGSTLGAALAVTDDMDGDGLPDLVAGDANAGEGGTAYLISGATLSKQGSGEAATDLSFAQLYGTGFEALGSAVAGLADTNDDGLGEVVVGAPDAFTGDLATGASIKAGAVYVWDSPLSGGLSSTAAAAAGGPTFTAHGTTDQGRFGASLATGQDVDGRGGEDLLVGAPGADAVFLFAGDPI